MAMRLAEIVTELMQSVLQHPAKGLVDEGNAPLFPFDSEVLGPNNIYRAAPCLQSLPSLEGQRREAATSRTRQNPLSAL